MFLIVSVSFTNEAEDIIKKLDNNMRGISVYMQMKMSITSLGHTRVMKMQSWSEGTKKSFVKVIYPPRDKGITFLSLDNQMWQYIPKIERTIKIPPSMMLQNWMGSDITNDDMVKQSSIVEDYTPRILKKEGKIVTLELIPKEDAAVVWGKIISRIDTKTYTSQKDIFFDEDGKEVREFIYKKVKKFSKYYLPTYWKIQSIDKKTSFTEISLEEVEYDKEISGQYFQKSALKRFSR
ncbi:outer membrane lipoprotein-sorting protein [Sulfurovum sp.]|uniref:outer membrane lipoprotein-sorting protein n=1 Tax=Sulfurovum sp. TaxID=1969726 RepID=UPI00286821E1|nr:outer membrane lipoprotein-sorting protein [Sulfurovum sp.]